jgi:hypothetical protein
MNEEEAREKLHNGDIYIFHSQPDGTGRTYNTYGKRNACRASVG